jgi:hypothetical protein
MAKKGAPIGNKNAAGHGRKLDYDLPKHSGVVLSVTARSIAMQKQRNLDGINKQYGLLGRVIHKESYKRAISEQNRVFKGISPKTHGRNWEGLLVKKK